MTVIDKKTKQKKKKIRKGNGKKSWHRGNSRRKNVGSSAEYLLETDRYDLIRMDHTMHILHAMEMDEEEEEDCDIVLEAWPQVSHVLVVALDCCGYYCVVTVLSLFVYHIVLFSIFLLFTECRRCVLFYAYK